MRFLLWYFVLVVLVIKHDINCKHHRSRQSKKSIIPKSPKITHQQQSSHFSHNLPWKEISKKSLIDSNPSEDTETMQKQKRGFLANLANLLNDAESISSHKETETKVPSIDEAHEKKAVVESHEETPISKPKHEENSDKKDVIDLSALKDSIKADSSDFAPIFAMYHGKVVELGKLPESSFKKSHQTSDVTLPEHHAKDVTASKRVLDETTSHKMDVTPVKREYHSSTPDQLKTYLNTMAGGSDQQNSITKDTISIPNLESGMKGDLINHVKGVVLDDGKVVSVSNNHLFDNNNDVSKVQSDPVQQDVQQKFMVNKEGNVEPLVKEKVETADAVTRDNLGNGQKTVTLTVDVLKQLLKKTGDSKVSLAQLLNKPNEAEQRSNTQEDEDPGTIEDFAAGGLKAHNEYRSKHHDDNVIWSDSLAAKAQKLAEALADKKSLEIAKDLEKEGMGENVAKVWATFKNAGEAATKMWYSQSENYHFDDPHLDENTGQFAQVVWKSTKELGMGVAKSIDDVNNKYVYVTALYSPPGNIEAVLRDNVLPTGNNTQDVYSTFFKRTGVINHEPAVVRRSRLPKSKKAKKIVAP